MSHGVRIHSKVAPQAQEKLLTDGALKFLSALHKTFETTRQSLLTAREDAQRRFDSGVPLDFPSETVHIRTDPSWQCAPPSPGLEDRRVEITGPTDRKMVINALNSGAKTFMADFEGKCTDLSAYDHTVLTLSNRFQLPDLCQYVKWPGQPSRRHLPPNRF